MSDYKVYQEFRMYGDVLFVLCYYLEPSLNLYVNFPSYMSFFWHRPHICHCMILYNKENNNIFFNFE